MLLVAIKCLPVVLKEKGGGNTEGLSAPLGSIFWLDGLKGFVNLRPLSFKVFCFFQCYNKLLLKVCIIVHYMSYLEYYFENWNSSRVLKLIMRVYFAQQDEGIHMKCVVLYMN